MTIYSLPGPIGRLLEWIDPRAGLRGKTHRRDKFEKFTKRARTVLNLAQEEAQRLRHDAIGPELLLLGLIREGEGVAAKVLTSLGVDPAQVRKAAEDRLGRGSHPGLGGIGLTPRGKKVIELTVDEARNLDHHYIGTEHLLLGLLREEEEDGSGVLKSFNLNVQEARTKTLQIVDKHAE